MTRKDYENARKNASKENTKASDDGGYLNQRLNMDWGWLRSFWGRSLQFNPAPPVPLILHRLPLLGCGSPPVSGDRRRYSRD